MIILNLTEGKFALQLHTAVATLGLYKAESSPGVLQGRLLTCHPKALLLKGTQKHLEPNT